MTSVYLLWHEYEILPEQDETKLLGVFSSLDKAETARSYFLTQVGFRDHPEGFQIAETPIDKNLWSEGFVTVQ